MNIDGIKDKITWCFWFGQEMSEDRETCLSSIMDKNNTILVTEKNINDFVVKQYPLHKGFWLLSDTHKSDYLRSYFMHFYGGVYSDIKFQKISFKDSIEKLENSVFLASGYSETTVADVASCKDTELTKHDYKNFIGLCQFCFKKSSKITFEWLIKTNQKMDIIYPNLLLRDGSYHCRATSYGAQGTNLPPIGYPLNWTELLGDIYHPIVYKNRTFIDKSFPRFKKRSYR